MNETTQLTTQSQPGNAAASRRQAEQGATRQTPLAPPVDIFENKQGITVYADLPGVPREKLDIRVQDGTLTIDAGAAAALRRGSSLLPAGVIRVDGAFALGAEAPVVCARAGAAMSVMAVRPIAYITRFIHSLPGEIRRSS